MKLLCDLTMNYTVRFILFLGMFTVITGDGLFVSSKLSFSEQDHTWDVLLPLAKCIVQYGAYDHLLSGQFCPKIPIGEEICEKLFHECISIEEIVQFVYDVMIQSLPVDGEDFNDFKKKVYDKRSIRSAFSAISALGAKITLHIGRKRFVLAIISKAANHPLGYAGDLAQFALEIFGYEEYAKLVGIFGNLAGGTIAGMGVGGPLGGVVGGATGLCIWGLGEYGGEYLEYLAYLPKIQNRIEFGAQWLGVHSK